MLLAACQPNRIYEQNQSVGPLWAWEDTRSFELNISDTVSPYHLFINIRHTDAYAYANCWLNLRSIGPLGDTLQVRVEIPLSEPDGYWLGECNSSMCLQRYLIGAGQRFPRSGLYRFELEQDMRENPLKGIQDVGIRLEKIGSEQQASR